MLTSKNKMKPSNTDNLNLQNEQIDEMVQDIDKCIALREYK